METVDLYFSGNMQDKYGKSLTLLPHEKFELVFVCFNTSSWKYIVNVHFYLVYVYHARV